MDETLPLSPKVLGGAPSSFLALWEPQQDGGYDGRTGWGALCRVSQQGSPKGRPQLWFWSLVD